MHRIHKDEMMNIMAKCCNRPQSLRNEVFGVLGGWREPEPLCGTATSWMPRIRR